MEPENTGLLQKAGRFFGNKNLGGDKDKQNVAVNSSDDNSMVGLAGLNNANKPKRQINFHQPLNK
jgi:hypothetical protein